MISIIVPIYNVAEYLSQCIESILCQTFQDIELILVDDGSTDGCYEICETYKRKDARIQVVHKKNGGLVNARKSGIKAASGQYIAYVDGDDWIEADMCERMHDEMTEQNVDIVMCGHYEDTGRTRKKVFHGIPEGRYGKQELYHFVYPRMIAGEEFFEWGIFPGVCVKLFKRECLESFQLDVAEDIVMGEDAACVYPCILNAESIYVSRECFYHYRQTVASMIKKVQDDNKEREQFRSLYWTVYRKLERYRFIFDVRDQWKKYILFLMVPRADHLLEGIEDLEYLFPFPKVKKGSRIVIYGMGTYGQRLYKYIEHTKFCNIVIAVDKNYHELQKQGVLAESPERIKECTYDAIVVANSFAKVRNEIYHELIKFYPEEKIHVMDENLIMSEEIQKRFGII